MADLGILALGTYTNESSTAIQGSDPVLEVIASTDDADYVYDDTNSTHTGTARFALGNVPSDFGTMSTVSIRLRYACASALTSTWNTLTAQVFQSDGSTALTNDVTVASSITTTTPTTSSVANFTGVQAGSKTLWDGAIVKINWGITKVKSGDTVQKRVFAAEITGTYTAGNTAIVGVIANAFTGTNTLKGKGRLAGAAAETFTGTDTILAKGRLLGVAAATITPTALLSTTIPIAGTAAITFTEAADLMGLVRVAPVSDISAGAWLPSTGSDLYAMIDEATANDSDYDYTAAPSAMEVKFASLTDPNVSTGHKVRYRLKGDGTTDAVVTLKEGATQVAQWTEINVPTTETDYEHTLSGAEADSITDYTDLRLNLEAA